MHLLEYISGHYLLSELGREGQEVGAIRQVMDLMNSEGTKFMLD
jgi:hypothetical protein